MSGSTELVHLTRGKLVEAIPLGDIAVVDAAGNLIAWAGDPKAKKTYWRSAAKPFQALPIVESGAADHYGIEQNELAQMCASHNGEDIHIATVRGILGKIGLDESYLQCGVHYPYHQETAKRMAKNEEAATSIHCNCSGKHSGMLTLCRHLDADLQTYTAFDHPVQQHALQVITDFSGLSAEEIIIGVDGCGVPVHGLSIYAMALSWARLVDTSALSQNRAKAAQRVAEAMMQHPYLVAGQGRTCTQLMQALPGRIVAKSGANAVYCFALPEKGIGVALKIADGGGAAVAPTVISVIRQLGYFSDAELAPLQSLAKVTISNHRKEQVGEIASVFELNRG